MFSRLIAKLYKRNKMNAQWGVEIVCHQEKTDKSRSWTPIRNVCQEFSGFQLNVRAFAEGFVTFSKKYNAL